MTQTKFTPAPWFTEYKADKKGMYSQVVFDSNGENICECHWYPIDAGSVVIDGKGYNSTITNREHNAHLIAAAPEMYELLATIENDENKVPQWLWNKIQATLAKARGEL